MNHNDQEFLVQKIRTQYIEKEHTELDTLKELDDQVRLPANVFGYTFGGIGTLLLGTGMSLAMTDLGSVLGYENPMVLGVALGLVGLSMAIANYPIYRAILTARRRKFGPEILALSEKLTQQ